MRLEPKRRGSLSQREHQLRTPHPNVDTQIQDGRVPRFRLHDCPKTAHMNFLVLERRICTVDCPV